MNPRFDAVLDAGQRQSSYSSYTETISNTDCFGTKVFTFALMQKMLPAEVFRNVKNASLGKEKLRRECADVIAVAMKEWATYHGATHFTHWFQPLTGMTAEKHDSFIEWSSSGEEVIEKFGGKQLIQGEPDASSFPSGGLRSTYEARGYTGWDPTSPVFLWEAGDGITLCIPSVFFSWTGAVLDTKIPLLRSDSKINEAVLRLLRLTGLPATQVFSTLGLEQEYFVIDRALRNLRPDLVMLGRTVFGSLSPKGQELQDHYFGSVKDRILCYMRDFEVEALKLGIPVKTRHNEVAPAQHEVAPVFEKASKAIDHNIQLMELMRQIAVKHNLSCLLHEKPFQGYNGSGKHSNWSLATDTGINLLDPTDTPENCFHFLVLVTAILHAVHEHSGLLRASIGSAANDYRLGGHEAPPAIISVYLGDQLEELLSNIEHKGAHKSSSSHPGIDLGMLHMPHLTKDNTDRNRTSPFAFTGNKFEFRAVGSSANPAFPITVLNVIVAESLNTILDEIEGQLQQDITDIYQAALPVIRKYIKASKNVRFAGDNYSEEWVQEASKRNLPILKKSIEAFAVLKTSKTGKAFEGVLTREELASRYEILAENYALTLNIEANLMIDIFTTQILPPAMKQQREYAASLSALQETLGPSADLKEQKAFLKQFCHAIEMALQFTKELRGIQEESKQMGVAEKAVFFSNNLLFKCEQLRAEVDKLETMLDDKEWPLPKYRELLFMV